MNVNPKSTSLERAHTAIIEYPRIKELHQKIRRCQYMTEKSGEPHCLSLEGVYGAGKSTIVRAYADTMPTIEELTRTHVRVLYFELLAPTGIRDVASWALRCIGDNEFDKGSKGRLTARLIDYIKECGVELVILDDFHFLIDGRTNKVLTDVSNWLTTLIKAAKVPFLVVGLQGLVSTILKHNGQLSRLFAYKEILKPFAWNSDKETIEEFDLFVRFAERAIEKSLPTDLDRVNLLYRLHYATNGVVGHLINLMRQAAVYSYEEQKETLALEYLERAFLERTAFDVTDVIKGEVCEKMNPFKDPAPQKYPEVSHDTPNVPGDTEEESANTGRKAKDKSPKEGRRPKSKAG